MRNFNQIVFTLMILLVACVSVDVMAQVASATPAAVAVASATPGVVTQAPAWMPPQWAQDILNYIQALPKVGPLVSTILMWLSILAVIMTTLSTAALAIFKGLSKGLDAGKMSAASDKVDAIYAKISPYLQYFSMYNAKLPDKSTPPSTTDQKPSA